VSVLWHSLAAVKLTATPQRWATIEKETYAAIRSLQKFKHWIFANTVTLYSDHNPITFLTETTPKSSKLMRWALSFQEYWTLFFVIENVFTTLQPIVLAVVSARDDGR